MPVRFHTRNSRQKNTPYGLILRDFGARKTRISPKYHQIPRNILIFEDISDEFDDVWPAKMRRIRLISQKKDLFSLKNERFRAVFAGNPSILGQLSSKIAHFELFLWAVGRQISLEMAKKYRISLDLGEK